ncbi:hypothetical protein [Rhodococcus sp. JVH1]|uniref:hypothetical protein n=1 Tax=Rhodococcus sp. JVH1 TaxID=745408 RepID=UPI0002720D28|nr:hypothetical protein [Rhodococcus sp. JVH1]EJJ01059.1 hypothetical protein JVH1_1685 [Rhodococcus sp. JVH1]
MTTDNIEEELTREDLSPFRDPLLANLVAQTNATGESLPVILTMDGSVISGDLISGADYFRQLGEKTGMSGFFEPILKQYVERQGETVTDIDVEDTLWIHVRDTTAISGSTTVNIGLWRGSLTHVTGWTFGKLS